ncbi:MAG: methylmalonyl Co-A mutase-associated GTPase MeaB, partial [Hyphomicrobiales bacterium]|nr:methylmalonyl Co-A mutase-associated GTPase MeaB [Hyphomicrobiales bacterium]
GKRAVARALSAIETEAGSAELAAFLDAAWRAPRGDVLGLTGPPGVGKSTLTDALIRHWRTAGETVGVIAVDPSSRLTGGALLGDRTRLKTDPDDQGVFVRSMAARDRLGGLSEHAIAATVVMRAAYDHVVVETVGIGQSEADIVLVADTILLCIQPASGDSLQFMKAGVMELPDVVAINKADMGAPARRAKGDVEGALTLFRRDADDWTPPVVLVSATADSGIDELIGTIGDHRRWAAASGTGKSRRRAQAQNCVTENVKIRFGRDGLAQVDVEAELSAALAAGSGPFAAERAILDRLALRFSR